LNDCDKFFHPELLIDGTAIALCFSTATFATSIVRINSKRWLEKITNYRNIKNYFFFLLVKVLQLLASINLISLKNSIGSKTFQIVNGHLMNHQTCVEAQMKTPWGNVNIK
jgi:hypothetical protein